MRMCMPYAYAARACRNAVRMCRCASWQHVHVHVHVQGSMCMCRAACARACAPVQVRFVAARATSADGITTLQKLGAGAKFPSGYTTQIIACRPRSAGRVRLSSSDPLSKPLLEDVHLSNDADLVTLREGIKLGRRMCNCASFDQFRDEEGERSPPGAPAPPPRR